MQRIVHTLCTSLENAVQRVVSIYHIKKCIKCGRLFPSCKVNVAVAWITKGSDESDRLPSIYVTCDSETVPRPGVICVLSFSYLLLVLVLETHKKAETLQRHRRSLSLFPKPEVTSYC